LLRHTLNLGILAHVDAGKTTLTERLLFAAGAIDELGSVDRGDTQTDTLLLEQERGITIKAAVVSFAIGDLAVNLVDTPGHPDFIAEVDRVLSVLDGAILVISAVEGVQSHSLILMRALQRLEVPTLLFVNKIDRSGADAGRALLDISERLTRAVVPVNAVDGIGTHEAGVYGWDQDERSLTVLVAERLADHDEVILSSLVDGGRTPSLLRLREALASQSRRALVHPVLFGSARSGSGIADLLAGVAEFLPAANGDPDAPLAGTVFKIERGRRNEKLVYVRVREGSVRVRDVVHLGVDREERVTSIGAFAGSAPTRRTELTAGEIGVLSGLRSARIGDELGSRPGEDSSHFAAPTLESVITVRRHEDRVRLGAALAQLAEEDTLINARLDETREEISVSLYGEIQKEVIATTLLRDFHLEVEFSETSTIFVERLVGSASAVEFIDVAPNPFNATVGLRVEPDAPGTGVSYVRETTVAGLMPNAYFKAVEDTVRETLRQGIRGWEVVDCVITMTHAGYWGKHGLGHQYFNKAMSSTGEDFRKLTPLVLAHALKAAGTEVYEPIDWFRLEVPADSLEHVAAALRSLRAITVERTVLGTGCTVAGTIPAGSVHSLRRRLPDLTHGEGVAEAGFDHRAPVTGEPPARRRIGPDPFDRSEYLKRLGVRGTKAERP
jgi:ribosomal protection tetracycline resistance protein